MVFRESWLRSVIVPLAQAAYLVVLLIVAIHFFRDFDFEALREITISFTIVAVAALLGIINRFWMAGVFYLSLGPSPREKSRWPLFWVTVSVFGKAWMSRYLPVKGAWVAHRLILARTLSVTKTQMATSTALETITQLSGMAIVAAGFLSLNSDLLPGSFSSEIVLFLGPAMLLALGSRPVLGLGLRLLSKIRGFDPGSVVMPGFRIYLAVASAQIFTALLSGFATVLIVVAIYGPISLGHAAFVIGLTAVANLTSVLAFFAPVGIGVREAILIAGLQDIVSLEVALAVAVVSRLWSVVVDLLFFGLSQIAEVGKLGNINAM